MPLLGDFLKEEVAIQILSREDFTSPFYFKVQERDIGQLSFDHDMRKGQFQLGPESWSISINKEEKKMILIKEGKEIAFCYGMSLGEGPMIMSAHSNIFLLRRDSLWSSSASLVEYETGCCFFQFYPGIHAGAASIKVEVCPIILDDKDSWDLLILSVSRLIDEEVSRRKREETS